MLRASWASLVIQMIKNPLAMQETRIHSLGWDRMDPNPLEKRMATHSSILAWRIPWTKESGGVQFRGSQRVRRDGTTKNACMHMLRASYTLSSMHYLIIIFIFYFIFFILFFFVVNFVIHWNETSLSLHVLSARTWCSGRTWRERVEREVGGGIGMGKTCKLKDVSFQKKKRI